MAIGSPLRFEEALRSREVRAIMPTHLSSAELEALGAEVMERAITSARVTNEYFLEQMEKRIRNILEPRTGTRDDGSPVTEGINQATARLELKEVLQAIGYRPDPEDEGTIKDLSSDARLNLIIETNVEQAQGYGQWEQAQDPVLLDLYPCQELFRAEDRVEERDWGMSANGRWVTAARELGEAAVIQVWGATGRMVARKDSPIWTRISRFGTPYPPFDFNSGMWVRDVDRDEAVELGLIGEWDEVQRQSRGFEAAA